MCVKINGYLENFLFIFIYMINFREYVIYCSFLDIIVLNVEIILKLLIVEDTWEEGIVLFLRWWIGIKVFIFILWNCKELKMEELLHYIDHCCIGISIYLITLNFESWFENLQWEKNVEKQVFMKWFWGKYVGKSW